MATTFSEDGEFAQILREHTQASARFPCAINGIAVDKGPTEVPRNSDWLKTPYVLHISMRTTT